MTHTDRPEGVGERNVLDKSDSVDKASVAGGMMANMTGWKEGSS